VRLGANQRLQHFKEDAMSTISMTSETEPLIPSPPASKLFRLLRTGDQAVSFEGLVMAEAAGTQINGRERDRGHDLRVYQTVGGNFIVEIVYWTTWKGEAEVRTVLVAGKELARVAVQLKDYDPLAHVLGYPPAERFAAKQSRLQARLRADYSTRVSDVLAQLPEAVERVK
jgi:hypothetical protein